MEKAYSFRFYPTPEQESLLRRTLRICLICLCKKRTLRMPLFNKHILIGLPGFSGYYSKELILDLLHDNNSGYVMFAYYCGMAGIFDDGDDRCKLPLN